MYTQSARWYDAIYSFKDYAAEAEKLRALTEERLGRGGGRLLDVGCGTGEHLRHLRRHYDVEGVDVNEAMLAVAREKLPGVPLHQADLLELDLGRPFDVVVCLFSAVGYLRDEAELRKGVAAMTSHLAPDGLLVVEPWILPEAFHPGGLHGLFVDRADLKLARMNVSRVEDGVAVMDMHHLVGTEQGIEYFVERHELTLFPQSAYGAALTSAGLVVEYDPQGLTGRGLFLGRPTAG
jgi:SAM-dependent methyltransferase